jgi:CHASE3 domain sensor protein
MNFLKKIFSGIRGRVLRSFFLIIVLFCIYGAISSHLLMKNKKATEQINDINQPSITTLTELELVLVQASNLTIKWIKTDIEDHVDKRKLKEIHSSIYPQLKTKIEKLSTRWSDQKQADSMKVLISKIDENFKKQAQIMNVTLAKFENYDGVTNLLAESDGDLIVTDINHHISALHRILNKVKVDTSNQQEEMIKNMDFLTGTNVILLLIIMLLGFVLTFRLSNQIIKPVHNLQLLVEKVSKGELEDFRVKATKDEIGQMMTSVQNMIGGLQTTAYFANEIGKGNLETEFSPLSEKDVLGNALITMRTNLVKVAKEDKQRNWANEGHATFGEILRSHHENMNEMLDVFLSKLVKYVEANQGWLYLLNDTDEEEEYLELKSVYAFDRKKFLNKKIYRGEGLAGQAWIEGELIFLTDIPKNYVSITSGLGDAPPTSVLIVPLKVNDNINGIIEFASFHEFQSYQIEFIQKLSESLSSTLSTLKINVKTKHLLEESQKQRHQMHEQEEEMRQNLEELQATQEEMERKQEETDIILAELRERESELSVENRELKDEVMRLRANLAQENP